SVDLPAPLGPMIETISPSATSKDTSLTATRPPKRLVRCDTRRRPVTVSSPLLRQQPEAQEPVGQDQHQRDQDAGIDEELVLARAKEEVPAEVEHERADQGTEHVAQPAEEAVEHEVDRIGDGETRRIDRLR